MDAEKLRNLTDAELLHQQRELNDQLFRLKFQLKMGQTESLNKIRGLRKDVARIHTVMREKQLGLSRHAKTHAAEPAAEEPAVAEAKAPKSRPATKSKAAKASGKARKK
jgi:large subunit ribosomal protein L29